MRRWTSAEHIKGGLVLGSRPEFDIYRTFLAKPKKGLGWFFPQGGERGNGEWDIAVLTEVTPLIRGQNHPTLLARVHTDISGVKKASARVCVGMWVVGPLSSGRPFLSRWATWMDDWAMSGLWQRRGTEPWPSSVPAPTSRRECDLIQTILADTARYKSKSNRFRSWISGLHVNDDDRRARRPEIMLCIYWKIAPEVKTDTLHCITVKKSNSDIALFTGLTKWTQNNNLKKQS